MLFIVCCPRALDTSAVVPEQCVSNVTATCHFFPAAMSQTHILVYLLYLADSQVLASKLLQQLLPYIDIQYLGLNPLKQCRTQSL